MKETAIIEALCKGVNPVTGELLDTIRDPRVDKLRLKLFDALKALDRRNHKAINVPAIPVDAEYPNRGKKWLKHDEVSLAKGWSDGKTLDEMVGAFGRTAGALSAKLSDMLNEDQDLIRQENARRGGEYGSQL